MRTPFRERKATATLATRLRGGKAGRRPFLGVLRAVALCLAALLPGSGPCGAAWAGPSDGDEPMPVYSAEFRQRVREEIGQRARDLRARLAQANRDSLAPGPRVLAAFALLRAGESPQREEIQSALGHARQAPLEAVYEVAATALAVAAQYDAQLQAPRPGGTASPGPSGGGQTERKVSACDLAWLRRAVAFLTQCQQAWDEERRASSLLGGGAGKARDPARPAGPRTGLAPAGPAGWGYGLPQGDSAWHGGLDISNTQYALLGLEAAASCGVPVSRSVWAAALEFLLRWQASGGPNVVLRRCEARDGRCRRWTEDAAARGFAYAGPPRGGYAVTGGRTAAGVCGMMICREQFSIRLDLEGRLDAQAQEGIRDGLAWLQAHYSVVNDPTSGPAGKDDAGSQRWHGAYLYGLERLCAKGRIPYIGDHDWYAEGVAYLVKQRSKGTPGPGSAGMVRLGFELLFLVRGTPGEARHAVVTPR